MSIIDTILGKKRLQPKVHFDITKKGLTLNGVFMERIDPEKFVEILGEPRKSTYKGSHNGNKFVRNTWIWDDLGFQLEIPDKENDFPYPSFRLEEELELQKSAKFNYFDLNPKKLFAGSITFDGKPLIEAFSEKNLKEAYIFLEQKVGIWKLDAQLSDKLQEQTKDLDWDGEQAVEKLKILRKAENPFKSFWFIYSPPKSKKVSSGKYNLPPASPTDLKFKNFNFKLAIIQELMYEQEVLTPKFDVYDFCKDYAKREIDPEDYYFEIIPEVKKWFKELPIPAHLADKVTQLYFDGGNDIYGQLIPQWDGEDDIFYIKSLTNEELEQFPNLKTIDGTAIMISDKVIKFLKSKGIEVLA